MIAVDEGDHPRRQEDAQEMKVVVATRSLQESESEGLSFVIVTLLICLPLAVVVVFVVTPCS